MIRILLADDQSLVRDGFRALIDREPDMTVVGEAATGEEAVTLTRSRGPDLVLMDIRMPGNGGLPATARILADPHATTKVLILTTFDQDDYLYQALRAGASGYLLKDVRQAQLIDAIRADGHHPGFTPGEIVQHGLPIVEIAHAIWAPIAAIEFQDDPFARVVAQSPRLPCGVAEREVRCRLADHNRRTLRRQA